MSAYVTNSLYNACLLCAPVWLKSDYVNNVDVQLKNVIVDRWKESWLSNVPGVVDASAVSFGFDLNRRE
jgi:hypothetical protein